MLQKTPRTACLQDCCREWCAAGSAKLETKRSDLRIPAGICVRRRFMGELQIRKFTPQDRKCAVVETPNRPGASNSTICAPDTIELRV